MALTAAIAASGTLLADVPGLRRVGPLACAIVIAVIYRQLLGYPERLRAGIQFSARRLLRLAVVLYGLRLNIDVVVHHGLGLLARDALAIALSVGVMLVLARRIKADPTLCLLLGVGTGVCGASAVAAVSPIVRAKEQETAIAAGIIALVGTAFAILYTVVRPWLPLSPQAYGVWAGSSIHEVAQVALAAAPAGSGPLAVALLAKLGRVFLLIPLSAGLMVFTRLRGGGSERARLEIPWFLAGFLALSLVGSYLTGPGLIPAAAIGDVSRFGGYLLTTAMVGLGLNVNLRDLRSRALRPLVAMVATSVVLSIAMYFTVPR